MAGIRWSLTAENDLRAIETFIAKDSVLHAISFIDRLIESISISKDGSNGSRVQSERFT